MLKKFNKKDQGFTLIEIILVLAIAGLILLLVFVALSGAQKTRRDTARKNDATRMLASIESCASNNNGAYGSCLTDPQIISAGYFSGNAPSGTAYTIGAAAGLSVFEVATGPCTGGPASAAVKVTILLEAGPAFCKDNG